MVVSRDYGPPFVCINRAKKVLVLEARDRVGGRTYTIQYHGKTVDVGGMWIGPLQPKVTKLVQDLGLQTHPQYYAGKHILEVCGQTTRYEGNISHIGLFGNPAELDNIVAKLDALAKEIDPENPHAHPSSEKWDLLTLTEWLRSNAENEGTRRIISWLIKVCTGYEAEQLSFLFTLFFLRQAQGYAGLADIKGGAQEQKIVGGAQQISEGIVKQLPKGTVKLSSVVNRIEQNSAGVEVFTTAGQSYKAKRVIVALPPSLCHNRIYYFPHVDTARSRLAQRMSMGTIFKVNIYYKKPFWREKGLSGQIMSDSEPLMLTYDASPPDLSYGALVGFCAGKHAIELARVSPEERKAIFVKVVVKFLGHEGNEIIDYLDKDWNDEYFSGGCFFNVFLPGQIAFYKATATLREPFGRIHWASCELGKNWYGYMEGAMESAEATAQEVVRALQTEKANL